MTRTVDHHFRNKPPQLRQTYEALIARLRQLGPLRVDVVNSSINLVSKFHFGGVSVRQDYLRVGFLSDRVIENQRIVRTEKLGPGMVAHSVIIRSSGDVDDDLMVWLKKAYMRQSR